MNKKNHEKVLSADIYNKTLGAFVLLMENAAQLSVSDEWHSECQKPAKLTEAEHVILDGFRNLERTLTASDSLRNQKFEEIAAVRDTVLDMERSLQLYNLQLNRLSNIVINRDMTEAVRSLPAPGNVSEINFSALISDCMDFVFEESDASEQAQSKRMSEVIGAFPLRMAKEKFLDYIRAGLAIVEPDFPLPARMNVLELLRMGVNPVAEPQYGAYFPEFTAKLEAFAEKINTDDWDKTTAEALLREAMPLVEETFTIRDSLTLSFESLNFLLILFHLNEDLDYILEDNFVVRDLYHALLEKLNSGEAESALDERLTELLAEESEKIATTIADSRSTTLKTIEQLAIESDEVLEDLMQIVNIWQVVSGYYFSNLSENACEAHWDDLDGELSDNEILLAKIDEFVQQVRNTLASEPPRIQRYLKNFFASEIPCPFSEAEFNTYLRQNLNAEADELSLWTALFGLEQMLNRNGFGTEDDWDEHEHMHDHTHIHGEDCDCGHEH